MAELTEKEVKKRNAKIVRQFKSGYTMGQLAVQHRISRQRVHQLLVRAGVTANDGGRAKCRALRIKTKASQREGSIKRRWGITVEHWRHLRAMHRNFWATPLGVYIRKRNNVRPTKRKWRLPFVEFLRIWEESGLWDQRGRGGALYGMHLIDPKGHWTPDNVCIKRVKDSMAVAIARSAQVRRGRGPSLVEPAPDRPSA
jgi:hypothetical protein